MSRDDGFRTADVDVGVFADPKVNALARRLRDPMATAAHVALFLSLVTESWSKGARATLEEALPAWWLTDFDEVQANLESVGLIDNEGRIPAHAWASWYGAADRRRGDRRFEGTVGGLMKSRGMTREAAEAEARLRMTTRDARETLGGPEPGLTRSVPTESVPTESVPSAPGARAHGAGQVEPDPAEPIFEWIEERGATVKRSNGHAAGIRDLVRAYGADQVLATAKQIDTPIADAGQVWKYVDDTLRPRPPVPAARAPTAIPPVTDYSTAERTSR